MIYGANFCCASTSSTIAADFLRLASTVSEGHALHISSAPGTAVTPFQATFATTEPYAISLCAVFSFPQTGLPFFAPASRGKGDAEEDV